MDSLHTEGALAAAEEEVLRPASKQGQGLKAGLVSSREFTGNGGASPSSETQEPEAERLWLQREPGLHIKTLSKTNLETKPNQQKASEEWKCLPAGAVQSEEPELGHPQHLPQAATLRNTPHLSCSVLMVHGQGQPPAAGQCGEH